MRLLLGLVAVPLVWFIAFAAGAAVSERDWPSLRDRQVWVPPVRTAPERIVVRESAPYPAYLLSHFGVMQTPWGEIRGAESGRPIRRGR